MKKSKTVRLLYGRDGLELHVPAGADVLAPPEVPAIPRPEAAVAAALERPIACPPLAELVRARRPRTVAVTISDITRPVPNRVFLPPVLDALNRAGVADSQIVIVIGTGMHRPSTAGEREILLGDVQSRVEVIDHVAAEASSLVKVCDRPAVSVNRRFAEADLRIVTGYIEPHFMAGFSGGRKGVCPALVDLATIQRFHGYQTLADPRADNGVLDGNPCHEIALTVARAVGVDFLLNVAITRDRGIAGIYCGELEAAHFAGCKDVANWTTVPIDRPYRLAITCGGGFPLDQTFYQAVKGMCGALPALDEHSTLLIASHCGEGIGSPAYADLMRRYDNDWRRFLADVAADAGRTKLDQWEFQVQARVLERIGLQRLWFVSDGLDDEAQKHIAVTPILGGGAAARAQAAVDGYLAADSGASVCVIPDGPYTMLKRR